VQLPTSASSSAPPWVSCLPHATMRLQSSRMLLDLLRTRRRKLQVPPNLSTTCWMGLTNKQPVSSLLPGLAAQSKVRRPQRPKRPHYSDVHGALYVLLLSCWTMKRALRKRIGCFACCIMPGCVTTGIHGDAGPAPAAQSAATPSTVGGEPQLTLRGAGGARRWGPAHFEAAPAAVTAASTSARPPAAGMPVKRQKLTSNPTDAERLMLDEHVHDTMTLSSNAMW